MKSWVRGVGVIVAVWLLAGGVGWAGEVHVYTDREIRTALLELLNRAEQTIDVEMYVLTDAEVIDALERAEQRGVQVRVILDPNQSGNQKHVERLKVHGVEVKWFPVNKPAQMHRKLAIVDGKRLFAGSVNWSYNVFPGESYCSGACLQQTLPHIAEAIRVFVRASRPLA